MPSVKILFSSNDAASLNNSRAKAQLFRYSNSSASREQSQIYPTFIQAGHMGFVISPGPDLPGNNRRLQTAGRRACHEARLGMGPRHSGESNSTPPMNRPIKVFGRLKQLCAVIFQTRRGSPFPGSTEPRWKVPERPPRWWPIA